MHALAYIYNYHKVKNIEERRQRKRKVKETMNLQLLMKCPQMLEGPTSSMEIGMSIITAF